MCKPHSSCWIAVSISLTVYSLVVASTLGTSYFFCDSLACSLWSSYVMLNLSLCIIQYVYSGGCVNSRDIVVCMIYPDLFSVVLVYKYTPYYGWLNIIECLPISSCLYQMSNSKHRTLPWYLRSIPHAAGIMV